ncbi:MAG: rhodanese-like domain-containing protein, partial [Candidatus Bipolaricaulis sp.]
VWAPDAVRTPPTGTPYYGTWAVVQPSQLAKKYQYVVDLRSPPTYAAGHFPGAENVALATRDELVAWAARLPRPIPGTSLAIWIVDEDGSQACDVAQYLQGIGFTQARCLFGGVAAWRAQFGDELLFPER